jgi:hypothetical protein
MTFAESVALVHPVAQIDGAPRRSQGTDDLHQCAGWAPSGFRGRDGPARKTAAVEGSRSVRCQP